MYCQCTRPRVSRLTLLNHCPVGLARVGLDEWQSSPLVDSSSLAGRGRDRALGGKSGEGEISSQAYMHMVDYNYIKTRDVLQSYITTQEPDKSDIIWQSPAGTQDTVVYFPLVQPCTWNTCRPTKTFLKIESPKILFFVTEYSFQLA